MIQTAINSILPKLQSLPFVENVSGLVIPMTKVTPLCDDDGNVISESRETFPIACGMSEQDCNNDKYQLLIPDQRRVSIFFFEELSPTKLIDQDAKGNLLKFTANVRLLAWLNLQKLGIEDCDKSGIFSVQTLCSLLGKCDLPSPFTNSFVTLELISVVRKSPTIFSKYTFSKNNGVFMYPFDYFAIDFKITICLNKNCLEDIVLGDPIKCQII